mgnify:CR=1 FL=1
MPETLRSLTIKLGYDVDTTGSDIFKASFKRLKQDLNRTSGQIKNKIRLRDIIKKPGRKPVNEFVGRFTKLFNSVTALKSRIKNKIRLRDIFKKPAKTIKLKREHFRRTSVKTMLVNY